jgi:hypothetical protein
LNPDPEHHACCSALSISCERQNQEENHPVFFKRVEQMVFTNDKSFFLTLDGEAAPAKLDLPTEPAESEESEVTPDAPSAPTLLVAPAEQPAGAATPPAPVRTAISTDSPAVQNDQNATAQVTEPQVTEPQVTEPKSTESLATPNGTGLTTAEAIAAELAAAEAARPEMTYSTYAPDNLTAGSALNQRRRAPGAAVKNFRNMAEDLFKS